jgi:hypothetical protein
MRRFMRDLAVQVLGTVFAALIIYVLGIQGGVFNPPVLNGEQVAIILVVLIVIGGFFGVMAYLAYLSSRD